MRQPIMIPVRGFKGLESCLQNESNVSAVLRDKMWDKMKNRQGMQIIYRSEKAYPERTFSISKKIDQVTRQKIRNALLSDNGRKASSEILKVFKRKEFVEAREEEYSGMAELLNPVWGYELR